MKWKKIIPVIFCIIVCVYFVSAVDFGYNNIGVPQLPPEINYSNLIVNLSTNYSDYSGYATTSGYSSNSGQLEGRDTATLKTYLQGLYDLVYCKLTGCTMSGAINMGGNNLVNAGNITSSGNTHRLDSVSDNQTLTLDSGGMDYSCIELLEAGMYGFTICNDGAGTNRFVVANYEDGYEWFWIDRDTGEMHFMNNTNFTNVHVTNINSTGNITADTYFGDAQYMTNAGNSSWNESMAYGLFLNRTSESDYLSTYNDTYDAYDFWTPSELLNGTLVQNDTLNTRLGDYIKNNTDGHYNISIDTNYNITTTGAGTFGQGFIRQTADEEGLYIYGFDDRVGHYYKMNVDEWGRKRLEVYGNADFLFHHHGDGTMSIDTSYGKIQFARSAQNNVTVFESATSGEAPAFEVYGFNTGYTKEKGVFQLVDTGSDQVFRISSDTGTIDFDDENLTTTGNIFGEGAQLGNQSLYYPDDATDWDFYGLKVLTGMDFNTYTTYDDNFYNVYSEIIVNISNDKDVAEITPYKGYVHFINGTGQEDMHLIDFEYEQDGGVYDEYLFGTIILLNFDSGSSSDVFGQRINTDQEAIHSMSSYTGLELKADLDGTYGADTNLLVLRPKTGIRWGIYDEPSNPDIYRGWALDADDTYICIGADCETFGSEAFTNLLLSWDGTDGIINSTTGTVRFYNNSGYSIPVAHDWGTASPSILNKGSRLEALPINPLDDKGKLILDKDMEGITWKTIPKTDGDNCWEELDYIEYCNVEGDCRENEKENYKAVERYTTECGTKPMNITLVGGISLENRDILAELKQENQMLKNMLCIDEKYKSSEFCAGVH